MGFCLSFTLCSSTRGANIEGGDKEGATPLITAAGWGHQNAVRLLLDAGADVQARDKKENSAVFAAITENKPVTPSLLTESIPPGVLQLILKTGGENLIDSELDRFQNTPLHHAAELGALGCLRELIKFGFEINAQNEDDKNALHLAAEFGRKKCCMELVKADKSTVIIISPQLITINYIYVLPITAICDLRALHYRRSTDALPTHYRRSIDAV
eukprot:sb/3470082/